jgi:hypothetical protein
VSGIGPKNTRLCGNCIFCKIDVINLRSLLDGTTKEQENWRTSTRAHTPEVANGWYPLGEEELKLLLAMSNPPAGGPLQADIHEIPIEVESQIGPKVRGLYTRQNYRKCSRGELARECVKRVKRTHKYPEDDVWY